MNKATHTKYNKKRPVFGYRPKEEEKIFLENLMSKYKMNKQEIIEYIVILSRKILSTK